jgi:hypothetical protein
MPVDEVMHSASTVLLYACLIVVISTLLGLSELLSNQEPATLANLSVVFYEPTYFWFNRKLYPDLVPRGRSCFGTSPNPRLIPDPPQPLTRSLRVQERGEELSRLNSGQMKLDKRCCG